MFKANIDLSDLIHKLNDVTGADLTRDLAPSIS